MKKEKNNSKIEKKVDCLVPIRIEGVAGRSACQKLKRQCAILVKIRGEIYTYLQSKLNVILHMSPPLCSSERLSMTSSPIRSPTSTSDWVHEVESGTATTFYSGSYYSHSLDHVYWKEQMTPKLLIFPLLRRFSPPLQCALTPLLSSTHENNTEADTHMCYIEPSLLLSSIFSSPFPQYKKH